MANEKSIDEKREAADKAQNEADRLKHEAAVIATPEPGPLDGARVSRVVVDEDGDGKADTNEDTTTLAVVEVRIERSNNEKVSAEVFECEVPILQQVHGEHAVIVGDHVYDVEFKGDASDLYRSFQRKYNSPQAGQPVERAYRNAKELADEAGLTVGRAKQAPASANVDNRKTAKKATKKAAKR